MSLQALSDYVVYSKYSHYLPEKKRRETWEEITDRVFGMHSVKYKKELEENKEFSQMFEEAKDAVKKKRVLGSQRALQFASPDLKFGILNKNEKIFNCFSLDTSFITSEGVKKFSDFTDGSETVVLTHNGNWKKATVKNFGTQNLNKITFKRSGARYEVLSTENHRWLLDNGSETTNLAVGDTLLASKDIFNNFIYEESSPLERLYWCYGFVFGDGTQIKKNNKPVYSMVRLCGKDAKYESRFLEMGFESSSPLSCEGDIICFTGKYLKTPPNPQMDSPELIRAFVNGYLCADGEKNRDFSSQRPYISIQASDIEHINFIRNCFPVAGVYIVSESELTGQETNFGVRPHTVKFTVNNCLGRDVENNCHKFKVVSISPDKEDEVWCLEVEGDSSFVLPFGLTTGNCTSTLVDRPRAFQEIGYVLLNGCGAGYSVQYHHIEKLPNIKKSTKGKKTYRPVDQIEGWSECWGVLINSFFENGIYPEYEGYDIEFDFSEIRPAGALIAGQFKAPGPQPLEKSLVKIKSLINTVIDNGGNRLSSLNVHDIICHIADAIISGGVRRSALICLFSLEDKEMRECKTGSWFVENAQRGRANNSVVLERGKVTKEQFDEIFENIKSHGEPGFYFVDDGAVHQSTNPCCQPSWASVLTRSGITKFSDIKEGDEIWSEMGWTKIKHKLSTGIKKVYRYGTTAGVFYGTENHRLVSGGIKAEAKDIESVDCLTGPLKIDSLNTQDIVDGVVLGDGSVHKASNNLVHFFIGQDDKDYFESEILPYIGEHRPGIKDLAWEVNTTISAEELPLTYNRTIPDRFFYGSSSKVASFLRGLYSANGSVVANRVTLKASSFAIIEQVQIMLSSIGIKSYYTTNKAKKVEFSNGEYECRQSYDLNISVDAYKFATQIGFIQKYKTEKLKKILENKSGDGKKTFDVISVDFVSEEEVFDIEVDNESHTYWTGGLNVSNCEIGFWPISEKGESGFGFCNLCEINGLECKTKEEFFELCKYAAFIGTLQAGYNSTPYLGKATEDILRKEALLGVSITGWMDSPNTLFNEENLKAGVEVVKEINEKVSKIIGVNPAARTTCTKPSGTASSVLMTGSGIHAQHSRKFLRRAQVNKKEFAGKMMKRKNKCAVVESVYSTNKTDNVISFPCEVNPEAIVKGDLSAIGFLEKVKLAYQNWVLPGTYTDRGLNKAVTHNISVTVNVGDDEWDGARDYIFENRGYFSGISLLSRQGDLIYDQAPFAEVLDPRELVERYGDAVPLASGLIVDGLHSFDNLWVACETALGVRKITDKIDPVEPKKPRKSRGMKEKEYASALANYAIELNLYYQDKGEYETIEHKKDWVRRAKQFSERYFNGDMTKMTYCLKHVSLWKDWLDIKREWKDIDWASIKENDQEYVDADTMAGASCSGGACEILK